MGNTRLVIFDLDGTLIDAYTAITKSFNHAMKKSGYPAQKPKVIKRAVGWGDANLLRPFVEKKDLDNVLSAYRSHHKASLIKYSRLFPGVTRLLTGLKKKGYILAVASNRPTRFSLILIKHLKLKRYFDYVLCADKLKKGKPHPEILKRIMRRFKVSPASTVYVGDMVIDAQAGRRAGVKTFIVTTGSSLSHEIIKERPFRMINRVTDLAKSI